MVGSVRKGRRPLHLPGVPNSVCSFGLVAMYETLS